MEEIKKIEFSPVYLQEKDNLGEYAMGGASEAIEHYPFFVNESKEKHEKNRNSVILFRITTAVLLAVSLIMSKVYLPQVYILMNVWLTEKFNLPSLML